MDMTGNDDEKSYVNRSYNVGYGRAPIDVEYVPTRRDDRRAQRGKRRAHHFGALSLLFLLGLAYWHSARPSEANGAKHHDMQVGHGCHGSTNTKNPQAYPASHRLSTEMELVLPLFNWTAHPPSKALNWTECYDDFFCARLEVPLDYSEPDGEQAAVALIKYPSVYPPSHEKYKGPILFNPGGPGGSGVALLLIAGNSFQTLLGGEFDLIGFDPRGVQFTTPYLDVFETTIESSKFMLETPLALNASSSSFSEVFARSKVFGKLVESRAEKYAAHVSTPTVATDMLNIVKAAGYDKLQYWGFSYGSVLGATFAAMYPDNVGRLIIDGVVDSEDYYSGLWSNNLKDTDAALYDVYEACSKSNDCPLKEDTADLVAARVDRILESLKSEPLPVFPLDAGALEYGILDYETAKLQIFQTLYNTHASGALLMDMLAEVEKGDGTIMYGRSGRRIIESLVSCDCSPSGKQERPWPGAAPTIAIACGDAPPLNSTLGEARAFYDELSKDSSFWEMWNAHLSCTGWTVQAKDRFKGSFEQNTSYPLLIIGNTADPVTPLRNAHKMSKGFQDSVVLQVDASGHCSISTVSICAFKAVRAYFQNGTLPDDGTVCQTESGIYNTNSVDAETLTHDELNVLDAAHGLQRLKLVTPLGGIGAGSSGNFHI